MATVSLTDSLDTECSQIKLSGTECNGVVVHVLLQAVRKQSKSIKTSIICFMTTTITTQAHSHKRENSMAENTKVPGMTRYYEDYYWLQAIRHKETFQVIF